MFSRSTRWNDACILINRMDASHFPLLLQRLITKLHLKVERPFSKTEEAQVRELLSLDEHQLELLLGVCSFAFQQVHYASPAYPSNKSARDHKVSVRQNFASVAAVAVQRWMGLY